MCVLALSCLVILAPGILANTIEVTSSRPSNDLVVDSIFNIPLAAIRQTSEAVQLISPENSRAIQTFFQIPVSTLEAVSNLVKQTASRRGLEDGSSLQRLRRDTNDAYSDEEGEGRTFHRIKKKKHKFQHQKPSHYGYFGQPVLFPGYYPRPPAWKPPQAVSQFVNIFGTGGHGNHGHHKPHYKPHGSHKPGHYQVWEDNHEEWPTPWSGGFFGLGPQYPFRFENKVAPRSGREYRSYTTGPISFVTNSDKTSKTTDNPSKEVFRKKDKLVFKN